MKHPEPTHYQTLGVLPGASAREVRDAYWALAQQLHPDLPENAGKDPTRFKSVTFAYGVLKDEKHRREYNEMLRFTRTTCDECDRRGYVRVKGTKKNCPKCKGVGYV